jgi:hypothetical protein
MRGNTAAMGTHSGKSVGSFEGCVCVYTPSSRCWAPKNNERNDSLPIIAMPQPPTSKGVMERSAKEKGGRLKILCSKVLTF